MYKNKLAVIFKFIITNILEKKFRTLLVILSISISAGLFIASNSIAEAVTQINYNKVVNYSGDSDIIIHPNRLSPSAFFRIENMQQFQDKFEFSVGMIESNAYYEHNDEIVFLNVKAICFEDLNIFSPVIFEDLCENESFEGKKLIISNKTSKDYNLEIGDSIDIEINNKIQKYTIYGVAKKSSFFTDERQERYAIIPLETIATYNNAKGMVSTAYIKLKDSVEKNDIINKLSEIYSRYTVREMVINNQQETRMNQVETQLLMMVIVVSAMSIYIIYSTFKVISIERMPSVGVLRSIGATKSNVANILIGESLLYGIISAFLGVGLSAVALNIMSRTIIDSGNEVINMTALTGWNVWIGMIFAIVISLISSIIPIIRISRISVKNVILNLQENKKRNKSRRKFIILLLVFIFSNIIPRFIFGELAIFGSVLCMIMNVISIAFLIPYIIKYFKVIFESVMRFCFGKEGGLAIKNIREDKAFLNNITLIAIGVCSVLLIITISDNVIENEKRLYEDYVNFDMRIFANESDRNFKNMISNIDGIEDTYGAYELYKVEYLEKGEYIHNVIGIDTFNYLDFWNEDIIGDYEYLFKELNSSRNILLSNVLRKRYSLNEGDYISLKMPRGLKKYKVIGFFESDWKSGDYALISNRFFRLDSGSRNYSYIYVKTVNDTESIKNTIKNNFIKRKPVITTAEQMKQNAIDGNRETFNMLKAFSLLTLLIGIIGIFNNVVICLMSRRKSLSLYYSIGMSKIEILKMTLVEAFTGGIIGGLVGVTSAYLNILILPQVFKAMDLSVITISNDIINYLFSIICSIVIVMIAVIVPVKKIMNTNIVQNIKLE
ncbi:ABC transporter permease [Herbivorax sp. ANBcel31]|uniref:ABC transporter permease n=1 Tax=Herbivorax sp. ANBcel31 TaxID=3069754 RepID=UPI0027B64091|nr:FtsX-like permease family protein [Herbivorax sp. ANBcel31]MDQ2086413.1 ABC transporter permease [Herbivorax sp. ANBcel31]